MSTVDLEALDAAVMHGLKNFQQATVQRIDHLYRSGQQRVLVADEVGLGKTLIARGAVVKMAKLRREEGDTCFKVIYICANQNIAGQNIHKLDVTGDARIDDISDSRLSMQHLKITEAECDAARKNQYIQLIALTPDTSFRITEGSGSVTERALMYVILKDIPWIACHAEAFERMMKGWAEKAWKNWAVAWYTQRVNACRIATNGYYPTNIILQFEEKVSAGNLKGDIQNVLKSIENGGDCHRPQLIGKLRRMFAEISIEQLQPDFVIMDEFQRFRSLIGVNDQESEATLLARQFLSSQKTRVLLLSATPYKLYSTMEEIEKDGSDNPYHEFLEVTDFLFEGKEQSEFRQIWSDYSKALRVLQYGDTSILQLKQCAEDAMYKGICRTERISVMENGDFLNDESCKHAIHVSKNDIQSYIDAGRVMQLMQSSIPVDYVKSCPFLLSFMQEYAVKKQIERYFMRNPSEIDKAHQGTLWINKSDIEAYRPLPQTNARLNQLQERAFTQNAEMLLWVPPTIPYYPLDGVWSGSAFFSKILVFSAWEMVPRMIGGLLSYEAERRTVGEMRRIGQKVGSKERSYFSEASKRYPAPRLRLSIRDNTVHGQSVFCLLYPSRVLAGLFNPIECHNRHWSIGQTRGHIIDELRSLLEKLPGKTALVPNSGDKSWYYLAPMLLDGSQAVHQWMKEMRMLIDSDHTEDKSEIKENESLMGYIHLLLDELTEEHVSQLGAKPNDLAEVLADMVLGSPAICVLRAIGHVGYAGRIAKLFVNHFNTTEATAIISLAYRHDEESAHWHDVLRYCRDGCLQGMLDEYVQLLSEDAGLVNENKRTQIVYSMMQDALALHSASYEFDTFSNMKNRINPERQEGHKPSLRTGFATGYVKSKGADNKSSLRRESLRNAFNSPMRPFVLATTSIGQEGLDFHRYCRVVMHWNLPGNPIDLEQREGRVNRYKCLAIRQAIASQYKDHEFKKSIWQEVFELATHGKTVDSDLIPYWCAGEKQSVKIERIVPMYPISQDQNRYGRLIKILSLYRLTLGQARQEELLEYLMRQDISENILKKMFFDLSPFSKAHTQ